MRPKKEIIDSKESAQADYLDFILTRGSLPPERITQKILLKIKELLNPRFSHILLKILIVHLVVGSLTLVICPQFGITIFGEEISIIRYFMIFGHEVCTILCGVFFLGTTLSISASILTREEIHKFNEYKSLITFLLCFFSLSVFLILKSPNLPPTQEILNWVFGAFAGGSLLFEISSKIKINILRYA